MTRLLIPLVAAVTLALLVVWLLQRPATTGAATAPATSAAPVAEAPAAASASPAAGADAAGAAAAGAAGAGAAGASGPETPSAEAAAEVAEAEVAAAEAPASDAPAAEAPPVDEAAPPAAADAEAPAADVPGSDAPAADALGSEAPAADTASADPYVPAGYEALEPLGAERRTAFEGAEVVLDAALDYAAVIETTRGVLVVELFEADAPTTVNNFVFLARHRYYDGIVFHRVIDGFMAQTGDPTGTGTGGPGYRFDDEIVEGLVHDGPGVLSMANAGPGTNGSQFFLTFAATPWLDGAHSVFGRVVEGHEVLDAITRVDPQQPSVVALLADPAASVRDQGIDLPGEGTVEEALTGLLGAAPVPGPGYDVAGARVAIGTMAGNPAAGFFPHPDRMERVTIVARPRG